MRKKIKPVFKKVPKEMIIDLTQDYMFNRVRIKGFDKKYLKRLERLKNKKITRKELDNYLLSY